MQYSSIDPNHDKRCLRRILSYGLLYAGVGRRSVSGANRGDPRVRAMSAGFHPAALSLPGPDRGRSGVGEEPDEIEGAGEGGARVSRNEAEVRLRESTLSRAEEERAATVRYLCASKAVCEPQKTGLRSVANRGTSAQVTGC